MLNHNARYYEWLLPYLEGGLDEARRAQLEARLAADPALAAEAERLRRTLDGLRGAAARTPPPKNAQVPADLWPHLRARLVLEPAPRPRARAWWLAGVGAPAAAALIVAAFWLPGWHTPELRQNSRMPTASQKAPPLRPVPPTVPTHPATGVPALAVKPQSAAKKTAVLKLPPPVPVVVGPTPFDLRVPAPPVSQSVNGSPKPPAVPAPPPGRPVVDAARPQVPRSQAAPITHGDLGAVSRVAPSSPVLMAPSPPPPPRPMAATDQRRDSPALDHSGPTATAGMGGAGGFGGGGIGGGATGAVSGTVAKETVNGLGGNVPQQTKSPTNAPNLPPIAIVGQIGQPLHGARRNKAVQRLAAPGASGDALQSFALNAQIGLDSWQAALSAAMQSPLWGETEGEQQANQALMAARESGLLDDLRARLEARRSQSPRDLVTGRMLAAVYEFGFSTEPALRERRRIAGLEGAGGEDWYALAHAEERAGNGSAARAAYRHALESPIPPSPFHAAIAKGRS